jgi:aryl-alcohol dehydrogenase-like predicted oxidoreductase
MEYVNLGCSGLKVSRICLGMMTYGSSKWRPWVLDEEESRPFIQRADRLEVSPAQVALAWLLRQDGINAPIIGASKMDQLEQAVAALDIELRQEDCAYLEEPYQPHPVLGHS